MNSLTYFAGARVDANQRGLPIDDQPNGIRAAGDAAFTHGRTDARHDVHFSGGEIDAHQRVRVRAKRHPEAAMADCESGTRLAGNMHRRNERVRAWIDLADGLRPG